MSSLIQSIAQALQHKKMHLITAESCTGGLIAKVCTDEVGSSSWFDGGVVSYSNALKIKLLNVDAKTLRQYGAVSPEVAVQMASGACRISAHSKCVSMAVTGIAGPSGGMDKKPVGTVCFAWAHGKKLLKVETEHFSGSREAVRTKAMQHGLTQLHELLIQL